MSAGLKLFTGLTPQAKLIAGLVGLLILIGAFYGVYSRGYSNGKAHVELANQKAINAAITQDRQSAERRQQEELAAATVRGKEQAAYETAIAAAPGGTNSPAAHARACERLRQAYGAGSSNIPASCRSGSSNGTGAPAQPQHR